MSTSEDLSKTEKFSKTEISAGWRAKLAGRRIQEQREELGWTQEDLARVLTHYGVTTTAVDVSRRERGVRKLTVDALLHYALALDCGIAALLVDDDGYWTCVTPERDVPPRRRGLPDGPQVLAKSLTPAEMSRWLSTGRWPGAWPLPGHQVGGRRRRRR
jgi:transcriptional regulator with XRE-family HTH domain